MKKLFLLVVVAAGFALTSNAQPVTSTMNDPSAPVMTFETDSMNFGSVPAGEKVVREFKFKNTGKTPLVISSATGSCSCTVPKFPTEPIAPGKTGVIRVEFNSAGKAGYQDKTATIESNNRDGSVILHLKGTVTTAPAPGTPAAH
jgi:hypothetical protein